jgi:hypothetical protein
MYCSPSTGARLARPCLSRRVSCFCNGALGPLALKCGQALVAVGGAGASSDCSISEQQEARAYARTSSYCCSKHGQSFSLAQTRSALRRSSASQAMAVDNATRFR